MKKTILILLLLPAVIMLSGCTMTNEEIIKEKNLCLSGGMDYEFMRGEWGIYKVICTKL